MGHSHFGIPLSAHFALSTQVKTSCTDTPQCIAISSSADSDLKQFEKKRENKIEIKYFCAIIFLAGIEAR
jgi:hypothetical protein